MSNVIGRMQLPFLMEPERTVPVSQLHRSRVRCSTLGMEVYPRAESDYVNLAPRGLPPACDTAGTDASSRDLTAERSAMLHTELAYYRSTMPHASLMTRTSAANEARNASLIRLRCSDPRTEATRSIFEVIFTLYRAREVAY